MAALTQRTGGSNCHQAPVCIVNRRVLLGCDNEEKNYFLRSNLSGKSNSFFFLQSTCRQTVISAKRYIF